MPTPMRDDSREVLRVQTVVSHISTLSFHMSDMLKRQQLHITYTLQYFLHRATSLFFLMPLVGVRVS